MRQLDHSSTDYGSHYMHTRVLAFETAPWQLRRLIENGLLFLAICTLWGLLLYLALTTVL